MVDRRDFTELPALLAEDIVFRSPFAHTPYVGAGKVSVILNSVAQLFEEFQYHRRFVAGDSAALEFSARIGALSLKGIDLIRVNRDGAIAEFEVMIRPANALLALGQEMGQRLAAQGITP
ncbi:MAG: nuclear transport factor 2 family protein [Caldilineaceae bacterium]|nr:nuclear transport factor 2 family protein [Caldilineaceae bacterium]